MLTNGIRDQRGATATEYAVMVGLILVVIATSVAFIGASVANIFTDAAGMFGS